MTTRPKLHVSADALRSQRLTALFTQEGLAEASGLHLSTIKLLESADRPATTTTVRKLSRALGCDASNFTSLNAPVQEQVS